jgi:hypothetical protein
VVLQFAIKYIQTNLKPRTQSLKIKEMNQENPENHLNIDTVKNNPDRF